MIRRIVYYIILLNLILLSFGCKEIIRGDDFELLKPEITYLYPEGIVYSNGGFQLNIGCENVTNNYNVFINGIKIENVSQGRFSSPIYCKLTDEELNEIFFNHDQGNFKFNIRILNKYPEENSIPIYEIGSQLSEPKELKIDWNNMIFTEKKKLFPLWENSIDPILKLNKNGVLCLTWKEKINDIYQTFFSFSEDEGETWSQVLNISRSDKNVVIIDLITYENNLFYLVWSEKDDLLEKIYFCKSIDKGLTWFNPVMLNNKDQLSFNPAITVDTKGKLSVAWETKNNKTGGKDIYFTQSNDEGKNWETKKIIQFDDMHINASDNSIKSILKTGSDKIYYKITSWGREEFVLSSSNDGGISWQNVLNKYRSTFSNLMHINLSLGLNNDPFIVWTNLRSHRDFPGPSTFLSRGYESGETWEEDINLNKIYIGYQTTMSVKESNVDLILRSYNSLFYIYSEDEGKTWSYPQMILGTLGNTSSPSMVKDNKGNIFLVYKTSDELFFIKGYKSF